jgi:4-amino-4-deoxy-L-arabinose transferase-like glycosyltransferase
MTTTSATGAARPDTVTDPSWTRPALLALLALTGVLYLSDLGASGWANAFYTAAVQAGTKSWSALFFGSFDAANSITVDKTPLSLWIMGLSARAFGLNSYSLLVPQALLGVGSVLVLHAAVRRWFGAAAGLLAGAVLAVTPVAALMFRFNNPDAALVLLLLLGAYAVVRSVDARTPRASTGWIALAGAFVGLAFLAKMMQAFLVVPVFALVFLVAAAGPVTRRIGQLLLAGLTMAASGGWWVAIVELMPSSARPYIGGSQGNSVLELMVGYNGLGRLTGEETGSVGGRSGWGETGWDRMFSAEIGGQVAWLLPAALALLVIGVVRAGRAPRTDRVRAGYLLWGGWLVVTGVVFSFMAGIFHAYYTVALAPAIGALVGAGTVELWRDRRSWPAAGPVLALLTAGSAFWAWWLLGRSSDFLPPLRPAVLITGGIAALMLLAVRVLPRAVSVGAAVAGLAAVLAGPTAYAVQTAGTAHTGSIPSAGPMTRGGFGHGPGGGPRGGRPRRGPGGQGQAPGQAPGQGQAGPRGAAQPVPPGGDGLGGTGSESTRWARGRGGMGGLLDTAKPSSEIVAALKADARSFTWAAATVGANNAAGYQIAGGVPVMPIGGFNGSDPYPSLERFQEYVAAGKIHYFIGGGMGMRSDGGSDAAQRIATWVQENYEATTIGGVTVYDLSGSGG